MDGHSTDVDRLMRAPALLLLLLVTLPSPAFAQATEEACTGVDVSWEVDHDDATLTAGIIHAPGCADGDEVGIQLLTEAGEIPAEPLVGAVQDERVRFDLSAMDVRIEPVTGVRVLLYGEVVVEIHHVDVEQRFFSDTGNEQRGLRRTTELEVAEGGTYTVPGAPTRYRVVACDSTRRWSPPADLVGQGAGTFTATSSGTHVICYGQRPGTPGGAPDVEDPTVEDPSGDETGVDDDERTDGGRPGAGRPVGDQVDVEGVSVERPGGSPGAGGAGGVGSLLATTGADLIGLGLLAMALVAVGRRMTQLRGGAGRRR